MLISRTAIREYLDRDFDNFLWMKKLTREVIEQELRQFSVRPRFKTEPWLHQLICFYIGLCNPRFLFLLDMGLGKSKIIIDLIRHYQREKRLERALITVPRLINIDSWEDDLAKHSDLEPWKIGSDEIEEKRDRLLDPRGDVTLIDYMGLHLALCTKNKKTGKLARDDKYVKMATKLYNFIGIDESHKLANHDSLWWSIMNQLTKKADFTYATTGTLFGREVEDLWGQFFLVDRGETFGPNLGPFRGAFFTQEMKAWKGTVYTFDKKMNRKLHAMLQHRSIRYETDEIPELRYLKKPIPRELSFYMSDEQKEHYLRALDGLIDANGNTSELDAQWLRMRQIVSGYLAWKDELGDHVLPFKKNPKLDGLEARIDQLDSHEKVVVCYDYTETGRLIVERIKAMKIGYEWFYGGTKDKSASRRRFMEDPKCRVFVMNSEAGGTGNDGLQECARYMFMYETPTNPTPRQQTIKRLHRPGQKHQMYLYDLVMRSSLDRGILDAIKNDLDLHDDIVQGRMAGKLKKSFFLGD